MNHSVAGRPAPARQLRLPIFTLSYHSLNLIEGLTMDRLGELESLLEVPRSRNVSLSVTGALPFNEGRAVQILEGRDPHAPAIGPPAGLLASPQ